MTIDRSTSRRAKTASLVLLIGGLSLFGCGDPDTPATPQSNTTAETDADDTTTTTQTDADDESKEDTGDDTVHPPKADDEDKP